MSSKTYFDDVASQWHQMRRSFFPEATRERAFTVARVQPGKLAADIGAGTGFVSEGLIHKGLRVIAVDQSEAMLAQMRRKFSNVNAIEYRVGESENLPIADDTVDYVFANMYLHHVESPPAAIREMARILKLGGKLVITDLDEHQFEFLRAEHHDRWMGFKREDVRQWFVEAGLKNVVVEGSNTDCCGESCDGGQQARISIFVASGDKSEISMTQNHITTLTYDDTVSENTIHESVRNRYAAIAETVGEEVSGCCGSDSEEASCGCSSGIYNVAMLEGLPADSVNLSLGCGDPVSIASLREGEIVLDLGSGGGIDCFLAARQVGPSGYVIGVDMTPQMLEKANAAKARMDVTNVEFRQGQIEALPVVDNSIDVILSNCVINLSPDKAAVFKEAFRVLKPGGRVSISDIVTQGEFSPELRADMAKWAECVTGAIDVHEYINMMREAGFANIEVVDKVDAVPPQQGMPRIFSARITAYKPA